MARPESLTSTGVRAWCAVVAFVISNLCFTALDPPPPLHPFFHAYPPPSHCPASALNIALGKATSQSTTDFGGVSSRAVDGNSRGYFSEDSVTHTGGHGRYAHPEVHVALPLH
jgi:hypothetical protein